MRPCDQPQLWSPTWAYVRMWNLSEGGVSTGSIPHAVRCDTCSPPLLWDTLRAIWTVNVTADTAGRGEGARMGIRKPVVPADTLVRLSPERAGVQDPHSKKD